MKQMTTETTQREHTGDLLAERNDRASETPRSCSWLEAEVS